MGASSSKNFTVIAPTVVLMVAYRPGSRGGWASAALAKMVSRPIVVLMWVNIPFASNFSASARLFVRVMLLKILAPSSEDRLAIEG